MDAGIIKSGTFRGVSAADPFAKAALEQSPVYVDLGAISWPANLAPTLTPLGSYAAGEKITERLQAKADVLIVLYTEPETSALLDVFTGNKAWSPTRRKQWCGYAHNFAKYKSSIVGAGDDTGLKEGLFGYLSAAKIGGKTVVLYKSELHPKADGDLLPFVPVMGQLISELAPSLVVSTGTAGAIGNHLQCGDVTICNTARFHCQRDYPTEPDINSMSTKNTPLTNNIQVETKYVEYAATNLTKLSLRGLAQCYVNLQKQNGYSFVKKNVGSPAIYVAGKNPVPGPQPMATVSADYLTVDDNHNAEGLQLLGVVNETDDAFLFYAISKISGSKPGWLSVRNASEPQIVAKPFPPGTSTTTIVDNLKKAAGTIYGIYQYCTTLNSAFACWGVIAGL